MESSYRDDSLFRNSIDSFSHMLPSFLKEKTKGLLFSTLLITTPFINRKAARPISFVTKVLTIFSIIPTFFYKYKYKVLNGFDKANKNNFKNRY